MSIWRDFVRETAKETWEWFISAGQVEQKNLEKVKEIEKRISELLPETYKVLEKIKSDEKFAARILELLWCSGCHSYHPISAASLSRILPLDFIDLLVPGVNREQLAFEFLYGPYWYIPSVLVSFCVCPDKPELNYPSSWERVFRERRQRIKEEYSHYPQRFSDRVKLLIESEIL